MELLHASFPVELSLKTVNRPAGLVDSQSNLGGIDCFENLRVGEKKDFYLLNADTQFNQPQP